MVWKTKFIRQVFDRHKIFGVSMNKFRILSILFESRSCSHTLGYVIESCRSQHLDEFSFFARCLALSNLNSLDLSLLPSTLYRLKLIESICVNKYATSAAFLHRPTSMKTPQRWMLWAYQTLCGPYPSLAEEAWSKLVDMTEKKCTEMRWHCTNVNDAGLRSFQTHKWCELVRTEHKKFGNPDGKQDKVWWKGTKTRSQGQIGFPQTVNMLRLEVTSRVTAKSQACWVW